MPEPIITRPLTPQAFAPYGKVFERPLTGRTAPFSVIESRRPGVPTTMVLIHLEPAAGRVDTMERHHHSGQCFLNLGVGRLLVVVAPDAGGAPDVTRLTAFWASPEQGFDYAPGVWHAGVSAIDKVTDVASMLCRDGSPADVEVVQLAEAIDIVPG